MKNRKLVVASASALAIIGIFLAYRFHDAAAERKDAGRGIVNPEHATASMTREAQPQASAQRFELPPSVGTGSYTEPKSTQPAGKQVEKSR